MPGALSGFRILDMTNFVAGPYATMLLADLGADVVKVETPPTGDPMRLREGNSGYSSSFAAINRGKRSFAVDVSSKRGRAAFERLLATADALVTSIRPRSRSKLGISYERLAGSFPRLVYCSLTGLGEKGATVDRPAFDTTAQALSGLLSLITTEFDKPLRIRALLSDQLAGLYACYGVLGALLARERTGRGQYVSTSLIQASIAFAGINFAHHFSAQRTGQTSGTLRTAGFLFICEDGRPLAIHVTPSPPKTWVALTEALQRPELRDDPRFSDKAGREKHYEVLHAVLAAEFHTRPRPYWLGQLDAYDVPCAPIHALNEVFQDPLVQELDLLVHTTSPFGEEALMVGSGVGLSHTPTTVSAPAPLLGQQTSAVLRELGYAPDEIEAYQAELGSLAPEPTACP